MKFAEGNKTRLISKRETRPVQKSKEIVISKKFVVLMMK